MGYILHYPGGTNGSSRVLIKEREKPDDQREIWDNERRVQNKVVVDLQDKMEPLVKDYEQHLETLKVKRMDPSFKLPEETWRAHNQLTL